METLLIATLDDQYIFNCYHTDPDSLRDLIDRELEIVRECLATESGKVVGKLRTFLWKLEGWRIRVRYAPHTWLSMFKPTPRKTPLPVTTTEEVKHCMASCVDFTQAETARNPQYVRYTLDVDAVKRKFDFSHFHLLVDSSGGDTPLGRCL